MKKYSTALVFIITLLSTSFTYSEEITDTNIDSILKIKPKMQYDQNLKYQEINKYKKPEDKEKKSDYEFNYNVDINKEQQTIDKLKIDLGINF